MHKIVKQQGPPIYSTGNYIQCLIITYNGKEFEKEYVCANLYIYIYFLNYFNKTLQINYT